MKTLFILVMYYQTTNASHGQNHSSSMSALGLMRKMQCYNIYVYNVLFQLFDIDILID